MCVLVVPSAMLHTVSGLLRHRGWRRAAWGTAILLDLAVELLEAIPKLVVLLACVTLFNAPHLVLKLYLVMGVIYAPQLYRAVQEDLAVLNQSVFLEATLTAGVPLWRIVTGNLLCHHGLHVVAIYTVLLAAGIVHLDAMLGFVGIRNRGEVFTWGSSLGMAVDEFEQLRPLLADGIPVAFNDAVVWGPASAVWLAIFAMFLLADFLKVPLGGYVYRLR
jgi:ABC-type dipeptide/oligopeptide/nickel transport system permease subunit